MRMALIAALALGACSDNKAPEAANGVLPAGPVTNSNAVAADALPPGIRAIIDKEVPGMIVGEVDRKEREGRIYYDVEGTRPDASEVELDILQEGETFRLVEIQRDVAWADAPQAARDAAAAKSGAFAPERVIESRQMDGSTIYELFAPGKPGEPAMEVRMRGGRAEVLGERWAH